ncbi:sporulation YhaL family protein [Bacillus sp. 165]|uniref:sporulation YhaL family protein n=1 Tax=Bacillus sp. 165 TaxID=1529117 RepID=UPI001AD9A0E0|nr:sporulation YhaL family protein [Bacillus sp. 165]MBO9128737.1 sporulation YhaL family protein [Bacillus sp. 165]
MELLPWWVYLVIVGIIISGYMVLYTSKKEEEIDQAYVEREGEIYMDRIREAREKQKNKNQDSSIFS